MLEQDLRAPAAQHLDRAGPPERRPRERDDLDDRLVERPDVAGRDRPLRELARAASACRAGAGRAAAGRSDGSQTSQHGPAGAGALAVAEVAQDAPRGGTSCPRPSAHTARYWRQRARVPSCAAERQSASARPSHVPVTRPSTRSGADGLGWIDADARQVADDRAHDLLVAAGVAREPLDRHVEARRLAAGDRLPSPPAEPVSARATALSAGSSTVERSMKKTCRPLSRADANSRQRAGAPSRPARPASW